MRFPSFNPLARGLTPRILASSAIVPALITAAFSASPVPQQRQPKVSIPPRHVLPKRSATAVPTLRSDVTMVLIPVTVTDRLDKPVTNLAAGSFRVFEDGVEQNVSSFYREDGPVSVGFIFDASSSMKNRISRSVPAIEQLLKTMMPGDEYFLIRFNDKPKLETGFLSDPAGILDVLANTQVWGWTSLHDAICMGMQRMKSAKNARRALFVLSDGGDNNSLYTESEVRDLARESDVRVYSIGLFERPRFLEKLAADTGGIAYWAHKLSELPEIVERMSQEFRNQYVLGYASTNEVHDGKYRKVKVELPESLGRMNLFWRRGYYATPD